jgi:glc operon protein GlcG
MTRRFLQLLAAGAMGLAVAVPSSAHTTSRPGLTLAGAKTVAAAAAAEARRLDAAGAIAVVDDGGNLLYLERLDDTFPAAAAVAIEKARTAATFRKATRDFENAIAKGRTALVAVDVMTPLQGGVPIAVGGTVVGAVGVSGAMSAQQDDDIATAAAGALQSAPPTAASVATVPSAEVAAAFVKGRPLVETATYKIHASRRDAPGQAEVHALDTDILYVLDGTATLVTGGEAVAARETAPDERRGTAIAGGAPRRLAKGDVVIVPNGVPHQFTEVQGPFLYYTVKVTAGGRP